MRTLLQRVRRATVTVEKKAVAEIGPGLVVFLGIRSGDTKADAEYLAKKISMLRIFADQTGKMNKSVNEVSGALLVVSQFTLYADTRKGNRPSYSQAAPPDEARPLYDHFVSSCCALGLPVSTGIFQAHMEVELVNDGPVTILCSSESDVR